MNTTGQEAQAQDGVIELLLTPEETSVILKNSPRTLEGWRLHRSDGPPYVRLSPSMVRYPRDKLFEWLKARTAISTSAEAM